MKRSGGSVTQEIKNRLNIIEIVKRYVDLRRVGNRWVAPCPFHQETQPSFSVNEEEGFFYCFGCQAAGDVFDFYSRINGLDFKETLAQLAEETGVVLQTTRPDPKAAVARSLKKTALSMYARAAEHFQANLAGKVGKSCRDYLEKRELSAEIIKEFVLGWSLPEWQGLADSLRRDGFTLQQGIEAGLLAPSDRGGAYDRFRGRLIFPIKNLNGQIIAFGGRIIGNEDTAKYINSTDSVLYKKGENLYGLYQARRSISAQKSVILTEGYMDVLTLHQFGYTNACGVLGTALTFEQVHRLAGFCSTVELLFDGDAPGRKAALRACEMVLSRGLRCKVIMLPEKMDIDELLHQQGVEVFEELRRFAPDGLDFCIRTLSTSYAPKEALEWVKGFIAQVEQPEFVSPFISRLSQGLDLDERELRRSLGQPLKNSSDRTERKLPRQTIRGGVPEDARDREVMKFVVRFPHHVPALRDAGAALIFTAAWAQQLWDKICACDPIYDPAVIVESLDQKEKEFWGHYRVMEALPKDTEQEELADICALIGRLCNEKQDNACIQALRQGAGSGDYDMELLKALNETLVRKRALGSTDE